jgi:adenylate cyclase
LTQVIDGHRGPIDKYMGEGIMAFWGASVSDKVLTRNAVLDGLEMQTTTRALRSRFPARGWPELHMGAGVNTGCMSVGNRGSDVRIADWDGSWAFDTK